MKYFISQSSNDFRVEQVQEQATEDQISGGSYAIIISSASFLINFFQSII